MTRHPMTRLELSHPALLVTAWLLLVFCVPMPAHALTAEPLDFATLIGERDGLLIENSQGMVLAARNATQRLIPASTLKVLTALVALDALGRDYRFPTDFYLDAKSNLTIKGYGDPLLISEVLTEIAQTLAAKVKTVNDIILDASYFARPINIPGRSASTQPYDAPNGALCANFNTVYFKYDQGRYSSAEPQTPLIPFVIDKIRSSGLKRERITFSQEQDDIPLYAGHLLRFFLVQAGVQVKGRVRLGQVTSADNHLLYQYRSRFDLEQVIARMLEFSNNFIANQLLIAAGAAVYSAPGTLTKGVRAAKAYARRELFINHLPLSEGSGISRENRVSANEFMKVLKKFEPFHRLMAHQGCVFFKTGTLRGISTRVGYVEDKTGRIYRFVVMINTPGKSIEPVIQQIKNHFCRS